MNSKRKFALLSGWSLIAMALVAGYAYGFVYSTLVVRGDADQTMVNIQNDSSTFLGGVIGWIIVFILDLIVAWGLYQFLKDVNPKLSLNTAVLRFAYTGILGAAIFQLSQVIPLIESGSANEITSLINSFEIKWSYGLIAFGLHLVGLALLSLKGSTVPNFLGWLLLLAGLCYIGVYGAKAFMGHHNEQILQVEMILSLPMAIGEIALAVWLVIRGGKK